MGKPNLKLLVNTFTCEECHVETLDYRFMETGAIVCENCCTGKTAEDAQEALAWDEFDKILAAAHDDNNDA